MEKEDKNNTLSFLETIVLLALNDKGWFGNSEQRIKFGLAGAVLFELEQSGEIEITGIQVRVTGTKETADKVKDSALEVLRKSKKELTIKKSIQRIVYKSGLKWKVLVKNLIKKNILKKEEYHFLWILSQEKYPLVNLEIKKQVLEELYLKLTGGQELSGKDLMLLAIMRTCRMIDKNFLLQEYFLKVRLKIKEITEFKEPLTDTSRKVKEIQEAIRLSILSSNVSMHI
jgi:Golgi phosphoprotein 3 (GPP34)